MNFKSTIGLEVHFELKTKSKIFSPSPVTYGAEANTETNVIDWAMPGVLPRLNKDVYRLGIMVALATHSHILPVTHFDRKNYFYPDNPKAYQIIHKTVKKGDVLKINEARGGGFAVSLIAK